MALQDLKNRADDWLGASAQQRVGAAVTKVKTATLPRQPPADERVQEHAEDQGR